MAGGEIMDVIALSVWDLGIAAAFVCVLSMLSLLLSLGLEWKILIFSCRMTAQLLLIGVVLRFLFADSSLVMVVLMAMIMLLAAGREVLARQNIRLRCYRVCDRDWGNVYLFLFRITCGPVDNNWSGPLVHSAVRNSASRYASWQYHDRSISCT